ncbi:MAG: flagellar basal body-associated FliL family protein [Candidatus Thiodiazotropha sp. (ex Dulcina madagascariensis)]|nr:flagellar basal body-associated FliL family protein [Candidatus Thiodiazotropha sp. (ex Dulcina madagascariensis)]MCU7926321.1 flagellar basal body-associated FliL family protein [Candidatus Thiodiazotropha sp. (ex Dulcina madagascariensis)]
MRLSRMLLVILMLFAPLLPAEDKVAGEGDEAKEPAVISYYQIKPALVANLAAGGKYIRCNIQLMTDDESFLEDLKLHGPAIRHALLLLLSEQDGNSVKTPLGKEALRKKALSEIARLMKKLSGKEGLKALFFTTFFVQ